MKGALKAKLVANLGSLHLDVELDTGPGTLVVVGPNGAGKSSLLSLLLGALPAHSGRVEIGGEVLFDSAAGVEVPVEQRQLGYVPQRYALFPHLTVRQNVAFGLRPGAGARVDGLLAGLGLERLGSARPRTLSGGEQQRVALARALSVSPRALLLDEPLAALDVHSRREVRDFLAGWLKEQGLPTVVVTHDPADARALGHRIAVLEGGRLTQVGTWEALRGEPRSRFVEEFLAAAPA